MTYIMSYIMSLDDYREQHPRPWGKAHAEYEAQSRREWASETLHKIEGYAESALDEDDPFQYIVHLTRVMRALVEEA